MIHKTIKWFYQGHPAVKVARHMQNSNPDSLAPKLSS